MSDSPAQRRFIAGAVCPRCAKMDTVVVDSVTDQRECVACGFSEARPVAQPQNELLTRVNRPARRVETPAEPVRLVDSPAPSSTPSPAPAPISKKPKSS